MGVRGKSVADAIELIENLASDLKDHVGKFEVHVEKQHEFNREITARVVDTEKADITIGGKLDTIIDRLNNKRIGWQIWLPFSFTAVMSVLAVLIQLWPRVVAP